MPGTAKYKIQSTLRFEEELARQKPQDAESIHETVEAIALSPLKPEPARLYKFLEVKERPQLLEMKLATQPRRLQILKNGFIVSYTIREYEHVVVMEDLNRHWSYKLPAFQPLLNDEP